MSHDSKLANKNIIWTPQPKQSRFLERWEEEVMYGGAAGGGKSDSLLAEALRQVHIPYYKGIIFRKSYRDLSELIDRSKYIYKLAYPKAKYNTTAHVWTFPSGATIEFGNISHDYKLNYQGKRYDYVGFDELTHFVFDEYMYLFSRNRPSGPGTRTYIRATCNPGGIGHGWVKARFIDPAPPLTTIKDKVEIVTPDGEVIVRHVNRVFVPASVFDNKILLENDPSYLTKLAMMPEAQKNALLYGDWNSFDGQVFTEWRDDPEHYDDHKFTHVITPFIVPKDWNIARSFDFGYSKPFSVGWYAVAPTKKKYRIAEYYGCTSTPNTGIKLTPQEIASEIKKIENTDINLKGRKIRWSVADPAIFAENGGSSIAQMMEGSPNFIWWSKGDHERIAGKMQFHYHLAFNEIGEPMFQVFNTCRNFIRTVPTLVYDSKHVEDIDTNMEDHIYDECRYMLMADPITPRKHHRPTVVGEDPLNLHKPEYNQSRWKMYGM